MELDKLNKSAELSAEHQTLTAKYEKKKGELKDKQLQQIWQEFADFFKKDTKYTVTTSTSSIGAKWIEAKYLNTKVTVTDNESAKGMTLGVSLIINYDGKDHYCFTNLHPDNHYKSQPPTQDAEVRMKNSIEYYKYFLEHADKYKFEYFLKGNKTAFTSFTEILKAL